MSDKKESLKGKETKSNQNGSNNKSDCTKKAGMLTCLVIIFLVGVSFISPTRVGGILIKRANILSDIFEYDDSSAFPPEYDQMLDTSFLELFKGVPENLAGAADLEGTDSLALAALSSQLLPIDQTNIGGMAKGFGSTIYSRRGTLHPHVYNDSLVQIEDFSQGRTMMSRFYETLAYDAAHRTVRIAVLGDSFIEADIITADLREQLQTAYGGQGVGFVPFTSPISKHRGTVKHTYTGWENYNIIKHKTVPEQYKGWFYVSGILSIPCEGAEVDYRGVRFRNHIETANTATLLFTNREHSSLKIAVNDSLPCTYTPPTGDAVNSIRIRRNAISRLNVKVENAAGFIGYGIVLEDSVGVSVHNYSVRSNSGMALLGTNYAVNSKIDSLMKYDLVILQYGLNAMSPDVTDYQFYARQLCRIIEYVKQCFPHSAILVMSVGDRSSLKNGTAVTMPAVKAMLKTQRSVAKQTGVGFWNTFQAMGGDNSMKGFVEKKWASKDHTHIGYLGGKYIAGRLASYIKAAVESIREQTSGDLTPILDPCATRWPQSAPQIAKPDADMFGTHTQHGLRTEAKPSENSDDDPTESAADVPKESSAAECTEDPASTDTISHTNKCSR